MAPEDNVVITIVCYMHAADIMLGHLGTLHQQIQPGHTCVPSQGALSTSRWHDMHSLAEYISGHACTCSMCTLPNRWHVFRVFSVCQLDSYTMSQDIIDLCAFNMHSPPRHAAYIISVHLCIICPLSFSNPAVVHAHSASRQDIHVRTCGRSLCMHSTLYNGFTSFGS